MKDFIKIALIAVAAFILLYVFIDFIGNAKYRKVKDLFIKDKITSEYLSGVVNVGADVPSFEFPLEIVMVEIDANNAAAQPVLADNIIDENFKHVQGKETNYVFKLEPAEVDANKLYFVNARVFDSENLQNTLLIGKCLHNESCLTLTQDNPKVATINLMDLRAELGALEELQATDACALVPDAGNCYAYIERYYFDQDTGSCSSFVWGGCDGVVPFETLERCQAACESGE